MTRIEQIRGMELGELADFLLTVGDFEPRGIDFCQNLPECEAALDELGEIPAGWCHNCMVGWLLGEADIKRTQGGEKDVSGICEAVPV